MLYLLVILLLLAALAFYLYANRKANYKKKLLKIMEKWGHPNEDDLDFKLISSYAKTSFAKESLMSDAIAADIDFENLFAFLDRTNSKPGQQYLYAKLQSGNKDLNSLSELDLLAAEFTNDHIRLSAEFELSRLDSKNAYYLHELFTGKFMPLYHSLINIYIKLAGLIWLISVVMTVITSNQLIFLIALSLTLLNSYLHFSNKKKITRYVHSLPQLHILIQVVKALLSQVKSPQNLTVKASLKGLAKLQNSLSLVSFEDNVSKDPSDIGSGIWELIKMFSLLEVAMFITSLKRIGSQKESIKILFDYIGQMDVAISIQSLRAGLPYFSRPEFIIDGQILEMQGLYHPLVENCVPNSIKVVSSQGVLMTGSNMSGKTTFIRSIAINALVAQTLFTSFTEKYQGPFLSIFTSIRVSDDLEEHKSYFQAEAISVLEILNESLKEPSSLIIIDEIFRGTNTIERVAAAKAILSYLTANQKFVFVSTHDLELAELLGAEYAVYSFEETVSDQRLVFDYKLKTGILKNKNGIAILSALGYPASITEDAYKIGDALRQKYNMS
jgi:hypothetical protein